MQDERKLYLIKILTDISEKYLLEIKPRLRQREKMICNNAIESNKRFTKMFDDIVPDAEGFGEIVDRVITELENELNINKQ